MEKLKRYVVPIELIVYGESPADAVEYAHDAIAHCDMLEQDGVVGITDEIDVEDVVEDH